MAAFALAHLTAAAASAICMGHCRAMCCRGPQYLRLTAAEADQLARLAGQLGAPLVLQRSADGSATLGFLDHAGDCCPFLDQTTWACRIYADRPARCRQFPEGPRPGCAISGG